MGLIPTYIRALITLHRRVGFEGPVVTLGNQDVWADHEGLKKIFDEAGCPYADAEVAPHTSVAFRQMEGAEKFVHARTLFGMMGLDDYCDIDNFPGDSPALVHDLNTPVPEEMRDRFGLIVDGGTIEHIFDVRQVAANVVSMCRESGWVVHFTPSNNYVDHGFYTFSPSFFYDLYRANGFGEFTCELFQADPDDFFKPCRVLPYSYGMSLKGLLDPDRVTTVFFAARKLREMPFAVPTQGIYGWGGAPVVGDPPAQVYPFVSLSERLLSPGLLKYAGAVRPILGRLRNRVVPPYKRLRLM
jgi:hypothetical protein